MPISMKTKKTIINIPNILTAFRILISPFFILFFLKNSTASKFIALAIFVVGALSDLYDGYLARKYFSVTGLGKLLDPIADKILTFSALICFWVKGYVFIVIIASLILRDIIITAYRFIMMSKDTIIPASKLAKFKTTLEMIAIILIILWSAVTSAISPDSALYLKLNSNVVRILMTNIFLGLVLLLSIISGVRYLTNIKDFAKIKT